MANNTVMMSYYETMQSQAKKDISIENYIGFVQHGTNQDLVLKARALRQSGDEEGYKKLKNKSKTVTGSAVMNEGTKAANNIKALNGLMIIDIDKDQVTPEIKADLMRDRYTYILHNSFGGGQNYCLFVKINKDKFEDSFTGLAQYYYENYDLKIDPSCSNKNRLRFLSYDPDLFLNEKAAKYIAKDIKKHSAPKETNFIYTKSDFDHILEQIKERHIDLCREDYHRYIRIGLSLNDKFGSQGAEYFHFICQYGAKYDREAAEKDYKGLSANANGKTGIGTFYYYCKDAGIEIYSPKTKTIINRVKIAKSQGSPTVDSVCKNLEVANEIIANDDDKILIKELIESKVDYSKEANKDKSEIEQIEDFIIQTYDPKIDVITNITYIQDNKHLTDTEVNDIYLTTKKNFDFTVPVNDVRSILNSSAVRKINVLDDFLRENASNPTGIIEQYANCIYPQSEYNLWAFRKWLVGALHNWTANFNEKLVCPLTLVLTGQQHGTGKTSFLRNIMPADLQKYAVEAKINGSDKDSMYMLCNALLVLDDEFGGKAFKDVKEYKSISDMNTITQRRPYERESKTYKRRAALCGTTNEIDILKDVTGNRRILPINVEKIDYDRMLLIDKTSLIIEAYNLLKSGFDWIIRTEEDIQYLKINSEDNEVVLPVEELFFRHFSLTPSNQYNDERIFNQAQILNYMLAISHIKPTKYDLKEVLTKNKIKYQSHRITADKTTKGIKLYVKRDFDNNNSNNTDDVPF